MTGEDAPLSKTHHSLLVRDILRGGSGAVQEMHLPVPSYRLPGTAEHLRHFTDTTMRHESVLGQFQTLPFFQAPGRVPH